jgi:hypothetical protein
VRRRLALVAAAAFLVLVGIASHRGASAGEDVPFDRAHSDLDLAGARAFRSFPLFWAGESHAGLRLAAITRRTPEPGADRAEYVSFLYGSCRPRPGSGCAPPLEIQVWPACVRTLADYRLTPFSTEPLPHENLLVRGVPAAYFQESAHLARLELYTGRVTVVLFGTTRNGLMATAADLRGLNVETEPRASLPRPDPRALAGDLECPSAGATTG